MSKRKKAQDVESAAPPPGVVSGSLISTLPMPIPTIACPCGTLIVGGSPEATIASLRKHHESGEHSSLMAMPAAPSQSAGEMLQCFACGKEAQAPLKRDDVWTPVRCSCGGQMLHKPEAQTTERTAR